MGRISSCGVRVAACLCCAVFALSGCLEDAEVSAPQGQLRVVEVTEPASSTEAVATTSEAPPRPTRPPLPPPTRPATTAAPVTTMAPPPPPPPPPPPTVAFLSPPPQACDPNYAGACVPIASDVDCAGGSGNGPAYVRGPVQVIGTDIYGLDGNDNDGIGCE